MYKLCLFIFVMLKFCIGIFWITPLLLCNCITLHVFLLHKSQTYFISLVFDCKKFIYICLFVCLFSESCCVKAFCGSFYQWGVLILFIDLMMALHMHCNISLYNFLFWKLYIIKSKFLCFRFMLAMCFFFLIHMYNVSLLRQNSF